MSAAATKANATAARCQGAVRKTEEAMLERSHWWLAAAVILIGTMVPFAVNETLGSEPDAGFVFFIWCALAAAVVAAGYGIWVATKAFARHDEASKRRRS
jgi:hypothetical protein